MHEQMQDERLLVECKEAVGVEKKSTARVLEYLCEIDRRRLWAKEGYSSLFDFCVRYLNYSEGESYRRIQACRLSSRVERVKPLLENGELSLTTMSLLSPVLTPDNASEILPQVINQPTREVEKVLTQHFPEREKKKEVFQVELDSELKSLLEEAERIASEKDRALLFKTVLKNFVREKKERKASVKRHTRYVQEPIAREVKKRDSYQCTYVGPKGIRCNQTAHLEIDHVRPFAKGGSSQDIENLRLLCKVHNQLNAKRDFPEFYRENPFHRRKKNKTMQEKEAPGKSAESSKSSSKTPRNFSAAEE